MSYHFEQLGPERFQQLVQALILIENPGLQCLPVAQPDGGRDGFHLPLFGNANGLIVYQVKYVRNPLTIDDPHKWLVDQLTQEAPKVGAMLPKSIARYYLITNLAGTAHLDVGSIDRLQAVLNDHLPVPSMAWWRDDLDRRIDKAPKSLRWSYPEILRGTDVLELLIDSDLGESRRRRVDILKAFVAEQYDHDEEVRFKQVELQNDLLQLFIDVPVVVNRGPGDRRSRFEDSHRYSQVVDMDGDQPVRVYFDERGKPIGAAALLLDEVAQRRYQFTVIEGAPGQGKSTLAQFICQVYRIRLRDQTNMQLLAPQHKPKSVRLPIKVDLTEYAAWQSGKNPFAAGGDEMAARPGTKSLESFIAALISENSGGGNFTVDDLHAVLRSSLVLIVLDGLDEVAETKRRDSVIREINAAARRFHDLAPDIQIVVTTRPSAFAGVSDFTQRLFYYLQLTTLTKPLITEYAERWTAAKRITPRDAATIRRALQSRLEQPHVRDLATNPMQLAILLSVIHSRGTSLPDKRTALYDIYVELFLARESEKTAEVREHNELLIDVHRFIAYTLHARAEAGGHLGRVAYDVLMGILRSYLTSEGRDPQLSDELFAGAQRVVFLVARVEGTFEFEVQPLREYFAGKYLYETSAYSPPGNERRGTMPDRFDALSRNPYWLNVTRFFAGSLSKGELPALVDRLQSLTDDAEYRYISHPRFLAATLLSDWVFSQHQRSLKAVVDIVLDGPGLRALARSGSTSRQEVLVLPSGAGRTELIEGAFRAIDTMNAPSESRSELTSMLNANAGHDELMGYWSRWYEQASPSNKRKWFAAAYHLGLYRGMDRQSVVTRALECGSAASARYLLRAGRYDALESSEEIFEGVLEAALDGHRVTSPRRGETGLERALIPFSSYSHQLLFVSSLPDEILMKNTLDMPRGGDEAPNLTQGIPTGSRFAGPVLEIIRAVDESMNFSFQSWRRSIRPWSEVVEPSRALWGDTRRAILQTAMVASMAKDPLTPEQRALELLDANGDLCARFRAARLRAGNTSWWSRQLEAAESVDQVILVASVFVFSAGPTVIASLMGTVDSKIRSLDDGQACSILESLPRGLGSQSHWVSRSRLNVRDLPSGLSDRCVALLGNVTPRKVQEDLRARYLDGYSGSDALARQFCTRLVVDGIVATRNETTREQWLELIRVLDLSGEAGVDVGDLSQRSMGSCTYNMPLDIARELAGAGKFPDAILTVAERVCELHTFESCAPLADIAEREEWFSNL